MHKNIVITGATDGIGLAAAKSIAKKDYHLILVGRNPKKGKKALETIISDTGNKNLDFFECDLSLVANVKDLSDKIKQVLPSLTEVSASSLIASILFFKDKEMSKVQSITFVFFEKNFLNFLNCEFVRIGLSKT